ncbi:DUF2293 domain-containing protein [Rhizobium binae]|uniref:DUF2293 domain-containing protein n=1 Tax=Rhizobium binae TaxID=1138190 RepID=UPI001C82F970|nr:DUF2293 domain-containing protein [Rhizobium binae]MBX4971089.1 DUF2293 domain-containing protein [Rhizobium binae]
MAKFNEKKVRAHFLRDYPDCPDFAVAYFVNDIMTKDWTNISIARAIELTIHKSLRHTMTDYDQLLLVGVDRAEARRRVQPKINAMIDSWKKQRAEMVARPVDQRIDPTEFAAELLVTDKIIMDRLAER